MTRTRVAVIGVGYLGRFHAQKLSSMPDVELIGVCDLDAAARNRVAGETGTTAFADFRDLLGQVDAVSIATTTSAHYHLARTCLEAGIHVLVEKPITSTSAEAADLVRIAAERALKLQVGHIERFNPALLAARAQLRDVRFIECHRLAAFKARGADVDVVLDLMIHDLDVILSLIDSEPVAVHAVGIAVLTDKTDIANARIEFANGAVANVTASRVSTAAQRKFRVFQQNHYLSIDFGSGAIQQVQRRTDDPHADVPFSIEESRIEKGDALHSEIRAFVDAVRDDAPVIVSGADGLAALRLAESIADRMAASARHP